MSYKKKKKARPRLTQPPPNIIFSANKDDTPLRRIVADSFF